MVTKYSKNYIFPQLIEELTRTTMCQQQFKILGVRRSFFPDTLFSKPNNHDPTVVLKFLKVVSATSLEKDETFMKATNRRDLGVC